MNDFDARVDNLLALATDGVTDADRENWPWLDDRPLRRRARRSNRACFARAWERYFDEHGQNVYTSGAIE